MTPPDLGSWTRREIAACGDEPVLLLGRVPASADGGNVTSVVDAGALAGMRFEQRAFRLAVAVGVLEHMGRDDGSALLATLRDLTAQRLMLALPAQGGPWRSDWSLADMLAHGLERLGDAVDGDRTVTVYGFDIDRYKATPDWLSPRNWANPENWGKYRW